MQQPNMNDFIVSESKPIKWVIPESIKTEHATNIVVQQRGSEFTILFFEIEPPLFVGTPEEQVAQYKKLGEVTAKCVARIVMSAENTTEAVNNLIESVNRFNMMVLQAAKGQDNARTEEGSKLSTSN